MSGKRNDDVMARLERLVPTVAKYLGYDTTAAKLARLAPLVLGFLVVLMSPTAWLSATLRTWAFRGMKLGSAAGVGALALLASRGRDTRAHAVVILALFALAAALLRLHLAVVDTVFVEQWSVLQPVQDF